MKESIILWFVQQIIGQIESEDVKRWLDMGLDLLEDKIEKSETLWDDRVALPMIQICREAFSIPDND